ncbi:MAG TPA: MFS transporter [Candidatus Mailhella merdavium]|nr:MFS transporter [Candidatus Mailhella merdavium]
MQLEKDCLPEPGQDAWPIGKRAAFFTFFLSCTFLLLDFIDRQVLAALFPYLKQDMGLSDTQLGLLVSVVNVSIAVLTLPTGYLIDRWSRKYMMGIMTFVWSLATGACAFAGGFGHLFAARFFVGAGEAGYVPAAQSLIAASFPRKYRSTALSTFVTCASIGSPLGLLIGAFIAEHWGWRHAFGVVAIPGMLAAFLCIRIKDFTVRRACKAENEEQKAAVSSRGESWGNIVLSILRTPSCLLAFLAIAANQMFTGVMINWGASYFNREAGMDPARAGALAAVVLVGLGVGHVGFGMFMDWMRSRGIVRTLSCIALACLSCFVMEAAAFGLCTPGSAVQVFLFAAGLCMAGGILPMGYTVTADLTPAHQRGTAVALLTVFQNLLGFGLGPLLVGMLSDNFGLGTSMMLFTGVEFAVALCCIGIRASYTRDFERMEKVVVEF